MRITSGVRLARLLHRRYPHQAPDLILEQLAQKHDVLIEYPCLHDQIAGLTWEANGRFVVAVNAAQAPERQWFTLAHELGHVALGHRAGWLLDGPRDDDPKDEHEANAFAAEFLMPAARIARWVAQGLWLDQLCKNCGVSVEAMTRRLNELGLWRVVEERRFSRPRRPAVTTAVSGRRSADLGNGDTDKAALLPF